MASLEPKLFCSVARASGFASAHSTWFSKTTGASCYATIMSNG